jgi:hypothetical protein
MENQAAVRLARDADFGGMRTIGRFSLLRSHNHSSLSLCFAGALTKPDTVPPGATNALQSWKEVLEGNKHPLLHGYYCVRLPDDVERSNNISGTRSARRAEDFFKSTSPWNQIVDRSRFGVPNLVANLSRILVQLIEQTLVILLLSEVRPLIYPVAFPNSRPM